MSLLVVSNVGLATWLSTGDMSTAALSDYQHLTEDVELQKLFHLALEARTNSYSPYSKFRVGACLLTPTGEYIPGTRTQFRLHSRLIRLAKSNADPKRFVSQKAAMSRIRPTD